MKKMFGTFVFMFLMVGFINTSLSTTINYDLANLGGNSWEYANDTLSVDIEGFSIFFGVDDYENLTSVQFDYIGEGTPGSQYFKIVDPFPFDLLDSGNTVLASVPVPESGTLLVLGLGLIGLFGLRRVLNKQLPAYEENVTPTVTSSSSKTVMSDSFGDVSSGPEANWQYGKVLKKRLLMLNKVLFRP